MGNEENQQLNGEEMNILRSAQNEPNLLLYFSANWCGACGTFKREVLDLLVAEGELKKRGIRLVEIDTDRHPNIVTACRVHDLPTVIFRKGDDHVDGFSGNRSYGEVRDCLREHYPLPGEG